MNKIKKILFILILFSLSLSFTSVVLANSSVPKIKNPFDDLAVKIPGMARFTDAQIGSNGHGGYAISIPWIAEYIKGLYNFAIAIVAIFAALTFLIGAAIWVTAGGNPSRIGEAKSWMASSILGLILALASYLLLASINVELVNLPAITMGANTQSVVFFGDPHSLSANAPGKKFTPNKPYTKNTYSIPCPKIQNSTIANLVQYYMTKQTIYYSKVHRGHIYGGKYYFDCSSFSQHLAMCAHLPAIAGEYNTTGLFITGKNNRQKMTNTATPQSLGLKVGDVVGYNDGHEGHVMMYIGNNQVIECGGKYHGPILQQHGLVKIEDWAHRMAYYTHNQLYYIKR